MEPNAGAPRLRRLIPAADGQQTRPSLRLPAPVKRKNITTACGPCRSRKSKCDGVRPRCHPCIRKRTRCEYSSEPDETQSQALKRRYSELSQTKSAKDEMYDILRTCSDRDASHILQKMRAGVDADSLLRYIKEADLLLQVTLPLETRFRYDFPIVKTMPRSLEKSDNLYLTSWIFQSPFHNSAASTTNRLEPRQGSLAGVPYQKPYRAARIVEPRLDNLPLWRWTLVTSDNTLMRNLLGDYFLHEYQWFPTFQKDYFLEDLASGRTRFCSELLVNAVLARACQNCDKIQHRADFWDPNSLYYKFFAEAKRLWDLAEKDGAVNLTTVQACMLIDICYRQNGLDKIGSTYLRQAIAMAELMQLSNALPYKMDQEELKAREFTAWCLFSYQVMQTYYFFQKPLINTPPTAPLPDPAQSRDWYGEVWVKYPGDRNICATHFGYSFKAMAELHALIGDIAIQVFSIPGQITKLSHEEALAHQSKLDSWFSRLPVVLSPANAVFPNQLKIQYVCKVFFLLLNIGMAPSQIQKRFPRDERLCANVSSLEFNRTLWTLWDAFTDVKTARGQCRIMNATIHFETLMRLYFLRHSFISPDSCLLIFLVTLGFASLERLIIEQDQEEVHGIHSMALLCARGLFEQAQNFYVAEGMLHLIRGKMGHKLLDMLGTYVPGQRNIDSRRRMAARLNRSELPLPTATLVKDLNSVKMEHMINEFQDLSHDENDSTGE